MQRTPALTMGIFSASEEPRETCGSSLYLVSALYFASGFATGVAGVANFAAGIWTFGCTSLN